MTDHEHDPIHYNCDELCTYDNHGTCTICGSYDYDPYRDSVAILVGRNGALSTVRCSSEGCNDIVRSFGHEGLCKHHHLELHDFRAIVEADNWGTAG